MSDSVLVSCPACDKVLAADPLIAGDAYDFRYCRSCELAIQAKPPADPLGLYDRENYDTRRKGNEREALRQSVWSRFNHDFTVGRMRMQQIEPFIPKEPKADNCVFTDFGCGNAAFLCAVRRQGFITRGIELDEPFCHEISSVTGIRTVNTQQFLDTPSAYPTCVLTLLDVFEHLFDPIGALRRMTDSFKQHGIIVMEVPDLAAHKGPLVEWKHFKPDEHLTAWSAKALETVRQRFFREFKLVHQAQPVPGKLQVIWQRYREI